jgi:pimeloyl-ACP methyl ester carboxylesterase
MATFCLLHGAWLDGSCWDAVGRGLEERGHAAVAPTLPLHDAGAGWDARLLAAERALGWVEGPVVVVGHSMGADYARILAARRETSLLVQLCPGFSPIREDFPFPPLGADGLSRWDLDTAMVALFGRLPRTDAEALLRRLRPMAPAPGERPKVGRPAVPTAVLIAAEDEIFDAEAEAEAASLRGTDAVVLPGGHLPMAEDPDGLATVLDRLATTIG